MSDYEECGCCGECFEPVNVCGDCYQKDLRSKLLAAEERITTISICELGGINQSVKDYIHHWESRAEAAEAALLVSETTVQVLRSRIVELEAGLRELGKHLHHTIKYPVGHIPVECPACKSVAALLGEGQDA